jgi:membrane-bound inhibitor of C-type lysozyme
VKFARYLVIFCLLVFATGGCLPSFGSQAPLVVSGQAYFLSDSGSAIQATYYSNGTVSLKLTDSTVLILPIVMSGSGTRYADDRYEWWEHQGEATYTVDGKVIFVGNIEK